MPAAPPPPSVPLRLAVCTDAYAPQVNGAALVTARSVRGLRALGWDVGVVTATRPDGEDAAATGVPGVKLPRHGDVRIALPCYRRIADALDASRPDLVHCPTEFVVGTLAAIAAIEPLRAVAVQATVESSSSAW